MRVGYLQFRPRFGEADANRARVVEALDGVEADLVVLPELAFTGYWFRDRAEAFELSEDPRRSNVVESLVALCRKQGVYLVTGFNERDGDRCYNSSLLIGPRGPIRTYRKIHLFNLEKKFFDPGDRPLDVHRVRGLRVGMMICFDWAFPEVARTLALRGADLIAHPSNLVLDLCQRAMFARCVENRLFAITANRYGEERRGEGRLRFTGRSQVVAPDGTILSRAPIRRDELSVCTIDPKDARDKMITRGNHVLKDRRPEFYD